ncbi:hypothetical protein [Spirosoma flavum]|uniref:Uncharacterized protein n=1 Tax=Spirosoma flavum TaxID=2048557 RepID=A0ABW6ALV0_9BACT
MENEHIKQQIVAETTALMPLKVDNEEVVKHKFRTIRDRLDELHRSTSEENEVYTKAFMLVQATMSAEYKQFSESSEHDEKAQALIQLKHKAAEICQLLQTNGPATLSPTTA